MKISPVFRGLELRASMSFHSETLSASTQYYVLHYALADKTAADR